MVWSIIVIVGGIVSFSCIVYSEIQLRKLEKLLKELDKTIDEKYESIAKKI